MARNFAIAAAVLMLTASPALARDDSIRSFDGTKIVLHFFPAADLKPGEKAPTVMLGPGWSFPGETDPEKVSDPTTGSISTGILRHSGFNVLTWDPRGFGGSEGTVQANSAEYEGRDAQALIDYLAKQPEAKLDREGDPRLGMAGGSYGGAIQLVTAGLDSRVDVIAPTITWNSIIDALLKNDTFKTGWASILYGSGSGRGRLDPHIQSAYTEGLDSGRVSDENKAWFEARATDPLVRKIRVPTLLMQGTPDTLFTLAQATRNYRILRDAGVPTKLLWFCGGHGACLTGGGADMRFEQVAVAWLKRYLNNDRSIDTGPGFEWIDQDGKRFTAPDYPLSPAGELTATGAGTLTLSQAGGSGPSRPGGGVIGGISGPTNGTWAANAINVTIPGPATELPIVGAPSVKLTYSGSGSTPETRVYAQIVDPATNVVVGNVVTPIPVTLDGAEHTVTQELEPIASTARPGASYTLQIVAHTTAYDRQRATGSIDFAKVGVSLPLSTVLTNSERTTTPGASRTKLRVYWTRTRGTRTLRVRVGITRGSLSKLVIAVRSRSGRVLARRKVRGYVQGRKTITVALRRRLPRRARVVVTGTRSDRTRVSASRAAKR